MRCFTPAGAGLAMSWWDGPRSVPASKERFQGTLAWRTSCAVMDAFSPCGSRVAAALRCTGQVLDSVSVAFDGRQKSHSNGARRHEGAGYATLSWLRN